MASLLRLLPLAFVLTFAACGDDDGATAGSSPIGVVATTTQMGDLVRAVGGADVRVTQLLAPNADPHDYEPRPSDVKAASSAQLVVRSGGDLDAWVGEVAEQAGAGGDVLDAGEGRPHAVEGGAHGHEEERAEGEEAQAEGEEAHAEGEEEHAEGGIDPHWWGDPRNVVYAAGRVAEALAKADPDNAAAYRRRGTAYAARVDRLDEQLVACVARVPQADRKLVTDHDAFATFAARYGFEVVGTVIPALTTQAQPSAGDLRELSADVRAEDVPVVFPESSLNPRLARSIAEATGARIGGSLWADTLGPKGSSGATYLEAQRANVDTIVRGLTDGAERCR